MKNIKTYDKKKKSSTKKQDEYIRKAIAGLAPITTLHIHGV
jgi:hypothetical protein